MKKNVTTLIAALIVIFGSVAQTPKENVWEKKQQASWTHSKQQQAPEKRRTPAKNNQGSQLRADLPPVEIDLPYNETNLPFDAENTVNVYEDYSAVFYTFEITEADAGTYSFSAVFDGSGGASMYFTLWTDDTFIEIIADDFYRYTLAPGTYYMTVDEDGYGFDYSTYSLAINKINEVDYTELDYSTRLTAGTAHYGMFNGDSPVILNPDYNTFGSGFTVTAEAGKTYSFTVTQYAPQKTMYGAALYLLTGGALQGDAGDWNGDYIYSNGNDTDGTRLSFNFTITAPDAGDYRLLLLSEINEAMYTITIKEIEDGISLAALLDNAETINSLPFTDAGVFAEGTAALVEGENDYFRDSGNQYYAAAYKIELAAGEIIHISHAHSGDAYLYVYDEGYNWVDNNDDGGNNGNSYLAFEAPATGWYYIVGTTYYSNVTGNYAISIWADGEEEPENPICSESLAKLLDESEIVNSLPFTDTGIFAEGMAALVEGDGFFRNSGEQYYAAACKIELAVGDVIYISHAHSDDAYLYVYDEDYNRVGYNDDGGSNGNSYLVFEAPATGWYYIVGTTFGSNSTGSYVLKIWADGEEEPENPVYSGGISLEELLDEAETVNSLPFADAGVFSEGTAALVEGEDYSFGDSGYHYYAAAYKIELAAGEIIHISHAHSGDAYLYVYDEDYNRVDADDNGGSNRDSYLEFTAPEAGWYYIAGTTYGSYSTGDYALKIWADGEEEPGFVITSLTPSSSNIDVPAAASEMEIKFMLAELTVIGTTDGGINFTIDNTPYRWVISPDGYEAVFTPVSGDNRYFFAEGVTAVVTLNGGVPATQPTIIVPPPTAIEEETEQAVQVYACDNTIYITGAPAGSRAAVYNTVGQLQASRTVTSLQEEITLPYRGIYIVKVNGKAYKVIIR